MPELTRTRIHKEDHSQIKAIGDALDAHCLQNDLRDSAFETKLDKIMQKLEEHDVLMPLVPTLVDIVDNQKSLSRVGKMAFKVLGWCSAFFGFIYLIFKFWKDIK